MRALTAALVLVAAVACTSGGSPDPAPTPSAAAPTATPTTAAPPALGGMLAFVTAREVRLAMPDGTVKTIGRHDGTDAETIAWTGDGRYVGWVQPGDDGGQTLHVYEAATGRTATWSDQRVGVDRLGGTARAFTAVHQAPGKPPVLVVADPARLLAGGKPTVVRLPLRAGGLVYAGDRRVLVDQPKRGAAFTGGPSTVYEVTLGGDARPLVTNRGELPVGGAALTADGRRFVYTTGDRINPDRSHQRVVVHDVATDRELDVPSPTVPGADTSPARSAETGADGRTVVTVHHFVVDRHQPTELGYVTYVLDGDAWRKIGEGATWAATGPTGALATISADDAETLAVDGRPLADGVRCAAWAP